MIVGQSCASYVTHVEKWNSAITDEYFTIRRSLDMNVSLILDLYRNARGVEDEKHEKQIRNLRQDLQQISR